MSINDYDAAYYGVHADRLRRNSRFVRQRLKFLELYGQPGRGERILDLGTGVGSASFECARLGADVIGLDFADAGLKLAKKMGAPYPVIRADGKTLPFADKVFDKIVCMDFVEHLLNADYLDILAECRRVLVDRGKLFIVCPGPDHIFQILRRHNLILKREPTHIGFKSVQYLSSSLQDAGFRLETAARVLPSHIPGWQLAETGLMALPGVGKFFQKTICVVATRPANDD